MAELIDKQIILDEITRRRKAISAKNVTDYKDRAIYGNEIYALMDLFSFIEGTEEICVPQDVDIEKEVSAFWDEMAHGDDGPFEKYSGHYISNPTLVRIARHFFGLGVMSGKGEYHRQSECKFKEGDWVMHMMWMNEWPARICSVGAKGYQTDSGAFIPFTCEDNMRPWTLKDAKDGDVLVTADDKDPFIFKQLYGENMDQYVAYCGIDSCGYFTLDTDCLWYKGDAKPATAKQSALLMSKMKDAGYEWDAEKKEVRKKAPETEQECNPSEDQIRVLEGPETAQEWNPSEDQIRVLEWCKPLFADPKLKETLCTLISELKKLAK